MSCAIYGMCVLPSAHATGVGSMGAPGAGAPGAGAPMKFLSGTHTICHILL